MGKFSELNLHWWEQEDLEELEEEYHISKKGPNELDKLASAFYWEAQGLVERANRLESKADTIRAYLRAIEE